jgi:hypothetical protein
LVLVGDGVVFELDFGDLEVFPAQLVFEFYQFVLELQAHAALVLEVALHAVLDVAELHTLGLQDVVEFAHMVHAVVAQV